MDFLSELLGNSSAVAALRENVERLLSGRLDGRRLPPLLIQGETGTGKGLLARGIHRASARAHGPFVDVNCAAIPDMMLEAELFGFERGAFTDAKHTKAGLFQTAHRGTIFLDEIGLLSPALQAKLLKVLEEKTVRRLGSTRPEPVDVWAISATNEDLAVAIRERRFREDLYHRLAVITLSLPPLRERGNDVRLLAEHFLARACADYGLPPKRLADDVGAALRGYRWPGNVRELSNVIERTALLADTQLLRAAHLSLPAASWPDDDVALPTIPAAAQPSSRDVVRQQLEEVLAQTGWNISRTAALLGITRNTVKGRIARYGLRPLRDMRGEVHADARGTTRTPLSSSRLNASPGGAWEPRRLTFIRVCLATEAGREMDSRCMRQLELAGDKLLGFGGRLEGVGPASLLAVFGLEVPDEPAVRAGHSALVIRNASRETWPETGSAPVVIGLHTVEIMVRVGAGAPALDADGSRREWDHLERAMEHAEAGSIVATRAAAALLRRRFVFASSGSGPEVYRIEGLWRADPNAPSQRGVFVGRREELALLESRLAAAVEGRGQAVNVAGESGIGKSRLLLELVSSSRKEGVRYLEGRCLPVETQTPFYPLLQVVRALCDVVEADSGPTIEAKVHRVLGELGLGATRAVEITYLLGASPDPPEAPGSALTKRLFTAVQRLVLATASRQPLLLAVEDLHWIDPTSEACLAGIAESIGRVPALLVTTFRTGYRPSWSNVPHVVQLALSPISAGDSLTLIRGLLQPASWSATVEGYIQTRAEGNPLFLEELSLAALERGDGSLPERIPVTVEDTIAERLAGLEPRSRRLLAVAAVIASDVTRPLLCAVADVNGDAFQGAMGHLRRADFLHEAALGAGEPSYVFKHALVQETSYRGLAPAERRTLHVRVLDAIEELYPERLADHVERLAHHAVLGDARDRAVRYLLQAGRKAVARSALAEAIGHLERGLELLQKIAKTPERDRCEVALYIGLGLALGATKSWAAPETAHAFSRAREISRQSGDLSQLGPVLVGQWVTTLNRAEYGDARRLAEELSALATRGPDPLIGAVAHRALGMTALYYGEFAVVRRHLEQGLALYRPDTDHARAIHDYGGAPDISCLAFLGRALWSLGHPDQALARNREAVDQARERGGALSLAMALGMLTSVYQLRGDARATREASERSFAHATEWGTTYWLAQATVLRNWADAKLLPRGESGLSAALIRSSLEQYLNATSTTLALPWFLTLLAEIHGASGQPFEGLRALDEALAHAEKTGERYHEAEIHRLRGELLLMQGDASPVAEACFRRALDVAQRQEAKGWELRAATSLARLWRDQGRSADAHALLAPVYAWFTEGFATVDLTAARLLLEEVASLRPGS